MAEQFTLSWGSQMPLTWVIDHQTRTVVATGAGILRLEDFEAALDELARPATLSYRKLVDLTHCSSALGTADMLDLSARIRGYSSMSALGDHAEQPLVLPLGAIAARLADDAGDAGELPGRIADHQPQPHDSPVAHQPAQKHRGEQARVDVAAAQDQPDVAALEEIGIGEQRRQPRRTRAFGRRLL